MSVSLLSHIIFVIALFFLWIFVYKKYKQTSGIFFLSFCVLFWIWYILYTVIYTAFFWEQVVLYLIRIMYAMSFIGIYSMLFFVLFFHENSNNNKQIRRLIWSFFFILFFIITLSSFFVSDVNYIESEGYFLEVYWSLYRILATWYIIYLPLFFVVSYFKIKSLTYINSYY